MQIANVKLRQIGSPRMGNQIWVRTPRCPSHLGFLLGCFFAYAAKTEPTGPGVEAIIFSLIDPYDDGVFAVGVLVVHVFSSHYHMTVPPVLMSCPVMFAESSEARKTANAAASSDFEPLSL